MGGDKTFWICIGIMIVGLLVSVAIFVPLMAKFGMIIMLFSSENTMERHIAKFNISLIGSICILEG